MEIVLLIIVIVLMLLHKSDLNSKIFRLEDKLRELNRHIERLKEQQWPEKPESSTKGIPAPRWQDVVEPELPKAPPPPPVAEPIPPPPPPAVIAEKVAAFAMETHTQPKPAPQPFVPEKSWWENFKEKNPDLEKFIGENLINKIGVLILVLGISYFVKYAIDKDWINEPARVGIGILAAALVMGFAHKLRKNYAAFSSVLVAGAIAIFYFTIGIAFHDYKLFGQTTAFAIMVAITAFSALVSLSYNRMELAVLCLIGGFAVPFMVSTGEGNYAVLFSYILILDGGILAMAYNRKWTLLNILSFVFTLILFNSWLFYTDLPTKQPHYAGALFFAFAFYLIFVLINIVNNIRNKGNFSITELSILSINTFAFYGVGMTILHFWHPELKGVFTTSLGILNLIYAGLLFRKFGADKSTVYLLIGLTLTFITLAVPIQFEGNYITLFWAAEAVLLLWLSQKSGFVAYRLASVGVHALMVISLAMDWNNGYTSNLPLTIALNPIFITGVFATLTFAAVAWLLRDENEPLAQFGIAFVPTTYRSYAIFLSLAIAYLAGLFETGFQAFSYIDVWGSASSLPVAWHLIASMLLVYYFARQNQYGAITATAISAVNILLIAFWFLYYPFSEHQSHIAFGTFTRIAFWLHYFYLVAFIYFFYSCYRLNRDTAVLHIFHGPLTLWTGAFILVYVCSGELILHTLVTSNIPVTLADVQRSGSHPSYLTNVSSIREFIAEGYIRNVRFQVIKSGFPILWGVLAFIFLILGIRKKTRSLRIIALTLLGVTIAKLFLYDIRNASETGKIIAFILLGVVILIISFVYQKLRVLVIDENKIKTDEEIN